MMSGDASGEQHDRTQDDGKSVFHDSPRILQYAATMPSVKDFRRLALALDGAIESAHMGHPDFRAHGRICATIPARSSPQQVRGALPDPRSCILQASTKTPWGRR